MLRDSGGSYPEMTKPETLIYTGIFLVYRDGDVENTDIQKLLLEKIPPFYGTSENPGMVIAHHVTLAFKPQEGIKTSIIGKMVDLRVDGYILNKSLGVQVASVEILSDEVTSSNENPHITISVREGVKPVVSNQAFNHDESEFFPFDAPLILKCPVGYFDANKKEVVKL